MNQKHIINCIMSYEDKINTSNPVIYIFVKCIFYYFIDKYIDNNNNNINNNNE